MKEQGTVISVEGGIARVGFMPKEACEHCGAKGFCHPEPGKMLASVSNELGARPGDAVTIETEAGASIMAAALIFLVPIAALIVGYLAARALWRTESVGVVGAVVMVVLSVAFIAFIDRRVLRRRRFMPRITSVTRREMTDMPRDAVCGMDVSQDTPYKSEYNGKTYYFCNEGCKVRFEENPGAYAEANQSQG